MSYRKISNQLAAAGFLNAPMAGVLSRLFDND